MHPESPASVVAVADEVGSTTQLIRAAQRLPNEKFIVATDRGIFYKMRQLMPEKIFMEAPTAGNSATCRSCAHCPWMAMNVLENLEQCLRDGSNEVFVDADLARRALVPLERMVNLLRFLPSVSICVALFFLLLCS